jgi:UDP-N-acetylglucosamine--N-acetylmuramyl-(pentapeptide) pyrophosphoryl-undecaprenol N-acetylglucosamine transferase
VVWFSGSGQYRWSSGSTADDRTHVAVLVVRRIIHDCFDGWSGVVAERGSSRKDELIFMVYAVVTGGGTSGHVIPAIAVCDLLVDAGYSSEQIAYVGSRRGVETSLMARTEYTSEFLPISGLQRSFTIRNIGRNVLLPIRLSRSRVMARRLIRKWKPSVVISVGGYASEPISRAAIATGVPLVCVSYDRVPGLATRRQSKKAAACAVAFDNSELPRAITTGAPVRRAMRNLDVSSARATSRTQLGIADDALVLAVVGGSLGARPLNDSVQSLLTEIDNRHLSNVLVYHVTGERFERSPMPHVPSGVTYIRVGYEEQMADLFSSLDLLVCRAGASTVAEVATVGIASVFVPWPGATDGHQELNARWLADAGAALLVSDSSLTDSSAIPAIVDLLADKSRREEMARHAYAMGAIHRSNALVGLIQSVAR